MPSGRDYPGSKAFVPPALEEEAMIRMRAPPDPGDAFEGEEDDSADEDDTPTNAPGAFPGANSSTSYY
jgi:hypothetical protein